MTLKEIRLMTIEELEKKGLVTVKTEVDGSAVVRFSRELLDEIQNAKE